MKKIISKTSKIFASVLVVMMLFVVGATNTTAASVAPNTINIDRVEVLSDLVTNHEHGFTVFNTTDGHWIYCMDVDKKSLYQNQGATLVGNGDAGLLYILQNGYPNKAITGNKEIDKYITQAVVWWYVNEGKMSDEFKNATKKTDRYELVPNRIKPMVEKARTAKDIQAKPSMSLQADNKTFTLSKDGKNYESPLMSASLVGSKTYKVEVTGGTKGTIIADENGNAKNEFSSSERFKVMVPASEVTEQKNMKVKLTAEGTVQKAKIYKPADTNYQRVVGLYDEVTPLEQTIDLSVAGGDKTEVVEVPNTSANIIFASVAAGVVIIAGAVGFIIYHSKKKEKHL